MENEIVKVIYKDNKIIIEKLGGNKNERNINGSLDRKMYIHL